ncbi:hypothetical protein SDC9_136619 [bioreactor metagenome]|uniref:DUF2007 domain-containing protein n=1 Tax=bioreactor metagenome TaxID=1076179 RepID=A0A645DJ77_9ZZZZ
MFFFGRVVYTGFSMSEFSAVRDALAAANIEYKYKLHSLSGGSPGFGGASRSRMGGLFINAQRDIQYRILVKKADYEQAVFVVRQAMEQRHR